MNILMLLLLGLSLSMDTFSLAISLGTINISTIKSFIYSLIVGIMHFILPIIGFVISIMLKKAITINTNSLLFVVFLFIAIEMVIDIISKEEKKDHFKMIDMLICSLAVSIDSLTTGLLFESIKELLIASSIFGLLSFSFTFIGLKIGKYCKYRFGKLANIIGLIIIIFLIILQL